MGPDSTGSGAAPDRLRVFISAKSADYEHAERVYRFLKDAGVSTFFSRESLPELGNTAYLEQIDHALAEVDHMVVVTTSAEHVLAPWVAAEWRFFINEQRSGRKRGNLLTMVVGALEFSDLPPSLRQYECLRLDDLALDMVLRYVRGSGPDRRPTGDTRPAPPRRRAFREMATFGGLPRVNLMAVRSEEPSIATGGFDGAVRLYDAETRTRRAVIGSERYWMAGAEGLITALEFSPDGRRVASGHLDGNVHVWDVDAEHELPCVIAHDGAVTGLAFSPDGCILVSASKTGIIKVSDLEAVESSAPALPRAPAPIVAVAAHRENNLLVIGVVDPTTRSYGLQVHEASGAFRVLCSARVTDSFGCLTISAGGRLLAAGGSDGGARVYEIDAIARAVTEQRSRTTLVPLKAAASDVYPPHRKPLKSVVFFPDGRNFVTSAMDGSVVIWDVETRKSSLTLQGAPEESYAGAAMLGDGRTLVAALADGRVRLWEAV